MGRGEYYFLFVLIAFAIDKSANSLFNFFRNTWLWEGEDGGYMGDF